MSEPLKGKIPVIPTKVGIRFHIFIVKSIGKELDPGLRRGDESENHALRVNSINYLLI
jgi:hypothetical protein